MLTTLNSEWAPSGWAQCATSNTAAGLSTYRLAAIAADRSLFEIRAPIRNRAQAVSRCQISAANLIASCSHRLACAWLGSKLGSWSQRYALPITSSGYRVTGG